MSHRVFDWSEIRRLYASGMSMRDVADQIGCSLTTVLRATNPDYRARTRLSSNEMHPSRQRACADCGSPSTSTRCRKCYRQRVKATRPGEIRCAICKTWKPDDAFYLSLMNEQLANRRFRTFACKQCARRKAREYQQRRRQEKQHVGND